MEKRIHVQVPFKGKCPKGIDIDKALNRAFLNPELYDENGKSLFIMKRMEVFVFNISKHFDMYITIDVL